MHAHKLENGYLLVLKRGELITKSLVDFCTKQKIAAATVSGIGAVEAATVGHYQLNNGRYRFKKFQKLLEIGSLTGNISVKNKQPWPHLHVVLGDSKLRAYSGHLQEATVGGTCEIYLRPTKTKLVRQPDQDTGLDLLV